MLPSSSGGTWSLFSKTLLQAWLVLADSHLSSLPEQTNVWILTFNRPFLWAVMVSSATRGGDCLGAKGKQLVYLGWDRILPIGFEVGKPLQLVVTRQALKFLFGQESFIPWFCRNCPIFPESNSVSWEWCPKDMVIHIRQNYKFSRAVNGSDAPPPNPLLRVWW